LSKTLVSVLIDTYNHERFIEKAIVSVLGQDVSPREREVIVVDDGSTDRTAEIVRKFEPHVKLVQKANGGQASAFNAGIPACSGEIIAFLDGDDWWGAGKLARVVEALEEDKSLGLIGHGIVIVHMDGRLQEDSLNESFVFQADTVEGARSFRLRKSFLGTSRMTIRADVLRRIGAVPTGIKVQADEYLFTLAAVLSRTRILPEVLTYYRMHGTNLFQMTGNDPERMRNKQESLEKLASSLREELERRGVDVRARQVITESAQAEADQSRLMNVGGSGWKVIKNEWIIYRIAFPHTALLSRILKLASLLPAIVFPAKKFYSARKRILESKVYGRARRRFLPPSKLPHVNTNWKPGPKEND
jgi:glycosyltransferase involved in cell wall biosynthesis